MTEFIHDPWPWLARMTGAAAGAVISLVYLLPQSRREAASRFFTGLVSGLVFGPPVGMSIAEYTGISGQLDGTELTLMGAAATSLCAWWGLGILARIAALNSGPGSSSGPPRR